METLLIVGIDTTLGANLALSLSGQFEICGTAQAASRNSAANVRPLGEATPQTLKQLVSEVAPRWIIHAGPLAQSSWEPIESGIDWRQETALAVGLHAVAKDGKIPHCFLSTDAVFSGPRLFHEETSRTTGMTPLAVAAREAERSLESTATLVVRTHAYGWGPSDSAETFIDGMWRQLEEGKRPACDGRHYATPILASDLAPLLLRAYEQELHGLYHITGAERTNRLRFVNELAAAAGCEFEFHSPLAGVELPEGPILETSLNTRKARRDLELPMPLLREGLDRLAAQRVNGYRDRLLTTAKKSPASSHAA